MRIQLMIMRFINKRLFISFLLVAVLTKPMYAQNLEIGFKINGNEDQVSIKFENHNNLIVVPIVLNNTLPLKFILDTGLKTAILTDRFYSDLLNVNYSRSIPVVGADGNVLVEAFVANNVTLSLPGITGRGQTLLALGEDFLQLKSFMGLEIHGIIGYELFQKYIVEIDYDQELLTFYEPASFKPPRAYESIDITIEEFKPYIEAQITQKDNSKISGKFLIDTGASMAISMDVSADEEIYIPEKNIEALLGRAIGGDISGFISRTKEVKFGSLEFSDVLTSYPNPGSYTEALRIPGRKGTIGGNILNRVNVIFDYPNKKIYARKGQLYKKKFEYNMLGIEVIAEGTKLDKFRIVNVVETSPAAHNGVKEGDYIIKINGIDVDNYNLTKISNMFRDREGRRIRLRLRRGDQVINKKMRLKRII
ncbi:aspartyl protease family protein [Peijinzhouia sedimentorum]